MSQFSRRTIVAATDWMAHWTRPEIDSLAIKFDLEKVMGRSSKADRANALARHLLGHPDASTEDGENLTDAIISEIVDAAISASRNRHFGKFDFDHFRQMFPELHRALERDGFTVQDGQLRRALPEALGLPKADDLVHELLNRFGFQVSKTHLDQGITAHSRGDWAAANAQFRTFIESLFNEIAQHLAGDAPVPPPGYERRKWLASRNPPFFLRELNEWEDESKGFLQACFRRLHPAGSHPGLSDEIDSTFRLHLVLILALYLLRRI